MAQHGIAVVMGLCCLGIHRRDLNVLGQSLRLQAQVQKQPALADRGFVEVGRSSLLKYRRRRFKTPAEIPVERDKSVIRRTR